jgi:HSP20 family protein
MMGPLSELEDRIGWLRREMDELFQECFGSTNGERSDGAAEVGTYPALNVWEDDQNLYAEAEMPGCRIEDLDVCVEGNVLTLRAERKIEAKENWTWHRRERGWGKFVRVLELPVPIDADKVQAAFRNGVLTITLPKAEAARPRRIPVNRKSS